MHAISLAHIRPTTYHEYSPSQLVLSKQQNISHLRIFGFVVYILIAPTYRDEFDRQQSTQVCTKY